MNNLAKLAWGYIPNKRQVLMTTLIVCVVISIMGSSFLYAIFNIKFYNDETPWQSFHRHSSQHTVHNTESIDNQTNLIELVKESVDISSQLTEVKTMSWINQITRDNSMDEDHNWKNDKLKEDYFKREREIKQYMDDLEKRKSNQNSIFDDGMKYAVRER